MRKCLWFLHVFLVSVSTLFLTSCKPALSTLSLSLPSNASVALRALSPQAKQGLLSGPESSAWFLIDDHSKDLLALEIFFKVQSSNPVLVSVGLVYDTDLTNFDSLLPHPVSRKLSVVQGVRDEGIIRMEIPSSDSLTGSQSVRGFAVSVLGSSATKLSIESVKGFTQKQDALVFGWEILPQGFWAGFSSEGGLLNAEQICAGNKEAIPSVIIPNDYELLVMLKGQGNDFIHNTQAQKERVVFKADKRYFSIRLTPAPYTAHIHYNFFNTSNAFSLSSGAEQLKGVKLVPVQKDIPLKSDPHLILDWPQSAWRNKDFEFFSWDRFPTILIFDTANYRVQDLFFKRLAFFVEKQGYTGRLAHDEELRDQHGFNAHDYRAESLAQFFEQAQKENFPLNAQEHQLEAILLSEGIIRKEGNAIVPGAGALVSVSRESAAYLRFLFMVHESFHGIYFISSEFREYVHEVYQQMDPRAIDFLQGYFSLVDTLGYDISDQYLMENEFMAYILQQSVSNVSSYFTNQVRDRFIRYKGSLDLASWIANTKAQSFVDAALLLQDFVQERWGLSSGRVGLISYEQ